MAIGLVSLRAAPRRTANQLFAFLLAVVALNFAFNFVWDYYLRGPHDLTVATRWGLAAYAMLILDPALMVYFSSVFPTRRALARRTELALGLVAVPVLLLILTPWSSGQAVITAGTQPYRVALFSYLGLAYVTSLGLIASGWIQEENPQRRRVLQLMTVAFGCVLLPRVGAITADLGLGIRPESYLITWAGFLGLFLLALLLRPERATEVGRVALWTAGLLFLVTLTWVPVLFERPGGFLSELTTVYTYRWFVFATLVAYALLRYQVFDVDLRLRKGVGAFLAVAVLLAAFFASRALVIWLMPGLGFPLPEAAGTLGAVVGLLPALRVARVGSQWVVPGARAEESYLRQRKLEVFSAAILTALEEARPPRRDRELSSLRARLGLSQQDFETLLALAEAEHQFGTSGPTALRRGVVLGARYKVEDQLGSGRYGRAYRARDLSAGRIVVVKELRPEWRADPEARSRFERESALLSRLRNDHVVEVVEAFQTGGRPYLVMEYLPGGSLQDRIARGPLDLRAALDVAAGVARGLAALHAAGILHRDVKPSNILFTREARPKLGDLGVAHVDADEGATLAAAGSQPGTLQYMSPEQARGAPLEATSDIYSLGAVLLEMLTGRPPIDLSGRSEFEARTALQKKRSRLALPPQAAAAGRLLRRCLAFDPARRFQAAAELVAAVEELRATVPG